MGRTPHLGGGCRGSQSAVAHLLRLALQGALGQDVLLSQPASEHIACKKGTGVSAIKLLHKMMLCTCPLQISWTTQRGTTRLQVLTFAEILMYLQPWNCEVRGCRAWNSSTWPEQPCSTSMIPLGVIPLSSGAFTMIVLLTKLPASTPEPWPGNWSSLARVAVLRLGVAAGFYNTLRN